MLQKVRDGTGHGAYVAGMNQLVDVRSQKFRTRNAQDSLRRCALILNTTALVQDRDEVGRVVDE